MTDQPQLFDTPEGPVPPARCPNCGAPVRRHGFAYASCDEHCGYEWRRSAQLASNEPWPEDVL